MGITTILKFLPFAAKHKNVIAGVLIVGGLFLYVMHLKSNIHELTVDNVKSHDTIVALQGEVERRNNDMKTANQSINVLETSISKQNKAIRSMNEKLLAKNKEVEIFKTQLETQKVDNKRKLDVILQEPMPSTCEDAIKYLINSKGDLSW